MVQTIDEDIRAQIEAEVRQKIKEEAEKKAKRKRAKRKRAKKVKEPKVIPTWQQVWDEVVWERTYDHLENDPKYDEYLDQLEKTNQLYVDFETHTKLAVKPFDIVEDVLKEKNYKNFKPIYNNILIEITGHDMKGEDKQNKGYALDSLRGKIRLVQLGDKKDTFIFDRYKCTKDQWERIGRLFRDRFCIGHNIGFECRYICTEWGTEYLPFHVYDTMAIEKLILCSQFAFIKNLRLDLGSTAERRAGIYIAKGYGGSDWGNPDLSPEQMNYAAEDIDILRPIVKAQLPILKNMGNAFVKLERDPDKELKFLNPLRKIHLPAAIECDCIPCFARMMHTGIPINRSVLEEELKTRAAAVQAYNDKWGFNLKSPKQLLDVLVNQYHLNVDATNADVLAPYDGKVDIVTDALACNSISTINGLLEGFLSAANEYGDNRVHPRFTIYQAFSGRTACREPNVQQIPREIKPKWMWPAKGKTIINLDYPAIEMRLMAGFCNERTMIDAFRKGKDLHKMTAAAVNKVSVDQVTKDQRKAAKAVNFGFLYGCSPKRFKQTAMTKYGLDYSIEECTDIRNAFFSGYPDLDRHVRRMFKLFPYGQKYIRYVVKTFLGRRMMADGSGNALNYSIQGSCADAAKMSIIYFINKIRTYKEGKYDRKINPVSFVHDEWFIECDIDCMKFTTKLLKKSMEIAMNYIMIDFFPVQVEPEIGDFKGSEWKEVYSEEEIQQFIDKIGEEIYTIEGKVPAIKPSN